MVKPRSVLPPEFSVMALVLAAVVVIVGFVPPVEGKGFVPDGAVKPVIESKDAVAPWPIIFSPLVKVSPPV
jgi:hypothetical protein